MDPLVLLSWVFLLVPIGLFLYLVLSLLGPQGDDCP